MKIPMLVLASLLFVSAAARAEFPQLSQDERARATAMLVAGERALLAAIAGLTDAQWNFRPRPEAWSIGDYAEYAVSTEDSLYETARKVGRSPLVPGKGTRTPDELLLKLMRDRGGKVPVNYGEVHRWGNRTALVAHFEESRKRTIEFVGNTKDYSRMRFLPHPVYGTLDGYQWILLMAVETEQAAQAIDALKAGPRFPR